MQVTLDQIKSNRIKGKYKRTQAMQDSSKVVSKNKTSYIKIPWNTEAFKKKCTNFH